MRFLIRLLLIAFISIFQAAASFFSAARRNEGRSFYCFAPQDTKSISILPHRRKSVVKHRQSFLSIAQSDKNAETTKLNLNGKQEIVQRKTSQIRSIRSLNLAGVTSDTDERAVCIPFEESQHLVAVTGETGSGKSLLIAKAVDLLTGGKAAASLVTGNKSDARTGEQNAVVEMELTLAEPHLSAAKIALERIKIDPSTMFQDDSECGRLVLRRTLSLQSSSSKPRLKSICEINGQQVTLKALGALASPLLASVDAGVAATALARPAARMSILDTAVSSECLSQAAQTKSQYRQCRNKRERLENELASRTLPQSFSAVNSEKDLELLTHWIDELDAFESRIQRFCESLFKQSDSTLSKLRNELASRDWMDNESTDKAIFSSGIYRSLNEFRDAVKSMEDQLLAVQKALEAIASLSSSESAMTAVERARKYLFDAVSGGNLSSTKLSNAVERSHELLNSAESALSECARFIEDDDRGLMSILEASLASCLVSVEDMDEILLDWNTLARKHGISPFVLPSCHKALKSERDGNVEARTLLPKVIAAEEQALTAFEEACTALTCERQEIADRLSKSVTERLPSLGMAGSIFRADLQASVRSCTDPTTYSSASILGVDSLKFMLLHGDKTSQEQGRGGEVHEVASSGEKARILLAVECVISGSIGAAVRGSVSASSESDDIWFQLPPIAVLYDEIDAHVGGRAAVALANMLADQSRFRQVVAITHSPSVAAIANLHIVIQPMSSTQHNDDKRSTIVVKATAVSGAKRRKELARMASGNMATEEAEIFAEALIRDGSKWWDGREQ